MVNESDSYRPDFFPNAQFSARDLQRPTFGRPQDVRGGNVKHVRGIAWSCDGRRVVTGGEYKELLVWDAKATIDAKASTSLPPSSSKPNPHNGHVGAVAWSPVDPNILVSGDKGSSAGGTIAIWNLTTPTTPVTTFRITGDVLHIAFHPSGRHFAVVCPMRSRDEVYFYWQTTENGKDTWSRREDIGLGGPAGDIGSEEINSLRFTNSGKLVCAVSNDGSINAWVYPSTLQFEKEELHPETGSIEGRLQINESGPSTSPSSPKATADDDAPLTGKSRAASPREGTPDEGGREGATGGDVDMDEGVQGQEQAEDRVDVIEGEDEGDVEREGEEKAPGNGGVNNDEEEEEAAATETQGQDVEMAEPSLPETNENEVENKVEAEAPLSNETEPTIPPPSAAPSRRPSPPATTISSSNPPAPIVTEKAQPRAKQLQRFRHSVCHSASLLSLGFDPRGKYLAVGGQDALLSMFDTRDWICERTFDVCTAAIRHIAFSQDGELIAMGGDDVFIAIVSVHTGSTIAKVPIQGMLNSLVWHPKRNSLAYSTGTKTSVPVWHVVHQE
ncbi:hypothetical protein IAR55_005953 [Kwoniella newhampshirensis]|uniref:Anaphase-promoting complex subunit 4 WD40 domain-containing protein n=1 Tax=Kwoniella newhampshirensis TaxID=1651941 RepID=A0AAW0YVR9_9TREE